MIESNIYTLDDGKTYQIDFEKTKDRISFETIKRVKFLTYDDLLRLRDKIDRLTLKT